MGTSRILTSRDNPLVRDLRALATDARETRRQGRTLIDGLHLLEVCLERHGHPDSIVVSESGMRHGGVAALLARMPGVLPVQVSDGLFRELSGVTTPVGILGVIGIPPPATGPIEGSCVMLDAVQDAGNVGAIMRTAAAAGVRNLVLGPGCAGAWAPRVLRAAQGAHFALRIRDQADLSALLRAYRGVSAVTVARGGEPVFDADVGGDVCWIFGNEGAGVTENIAALATRRVTIPLAAETESLNVAAAAAICLFEGVRQRRSRGEETHE